MEAVKKVRCQIGFCVFMFSLQDFRSDIEVLGVAWHDFLPDPEPYEFQI